MQRGVYIFIGPPGSGKGTLSAWCRETFGWELLSTGRLCRQRVADGTVVGSQIDFALKSGKLVSDQVITEVVVDWFMHKVQQIFTIILDGFPRTVVQARAFHQALRDAVSDCMIFVVELEVDDGTVMERLARRYICANRDCQVTYALATSSNGGICSVCNSSLIRRDDDAAEFVRERLVTYRQHRDGLLHFYDSLGVPIKRLNAGVPREALFSQFDAIVKYWTA
jgi:adenylate kinase